MASSTWIPPKESATVPIIRVDPSIAPKRARPWLSCRSARMTSATAKSSSSRM
jgi:hypothetical protein